MSIQGGKILVGASAIESEGNFVQPTIVEISSDAPVVKEELFGPVLYVMKFQVMRLMLLSILQTFLSTTLLYIFYHLLSALFYRFLFKCHMLISRILF